MESPSAVAGNSVHDAGALDIQNSDAVVAEFRDEQALVRRVERQVVDAADDVAESAAHDAALRRYYERIVADGRQPLIIDCGANIGCASVWFATQYPKARILAVEPDPDNFRMLVRNSKPYAVMPT